MSCQEVAEGVHRHVQLGALLALGTVVSGPRPALRRGAQRTAVEHRSRGLLITPGGQAQHGAKVMRQFLEAAGVQPALRLLVDGSPGRQIGGHPAPGRTRLDDGAQAVEHLTQGVSPLTRLFGQERQVRRYERPFLIGDVGGIRFACRGHPARTAMASSQIHNSL